jgi:hypothetical protein
MMKKTSSIVMLLLMISPLFLSIVGIPQEVASGTLNNTDSAVPAETNLGRVVWSTDLFPNPGMEDWTDSHNPENIYTVRSTEEASWYETTIVNEGARSFGMHGRALDPTHYSDVRLTQQSWVYWDNPLNTTLDFDWYLDEIGNPVDQNYYMMHVQISYRSIYYYIGCTRTGLVNGSYGYIFIDGATKTWNHLHLNLTSDYIELFGTQPVQFQLVEWFVRSYTDAYTRIYMDDVKLVNGTTVKVGGSTLNGNFESSGGWTFQSSYDPADISRSSVRHEGDWSMNMTVLSNDYTSYAYASYQPCKLISSSNEGQLSFWWRIDDWVNPTENSYVRMLITATNATTDFEMYYFFALGGSGTLPIILMSNAIKSKAQNFNVTNTWNFFEANIWEDFSSVYDTENLWIDEIEFQVRTTEDNSRLSALFDSITFQTSILNDMDYEHQNQVGSALQGWTQYPDASHLTVTDFSASGGKAANLTLTGSDSYYVDQTIGRLPINSNTELILDFNVYIDSFNISSEDFVLLMLQFDDETFSYVLANSTDNFESALGEESEYYVLLQDTVLIGGWMNFQLDIVHDYEQVAGSAPNTYLTYLTLTAETGLSSKLTVYFDDLYIYYDPAPTISDVHHSLTYAPGGGPASAYITANVADATLASVVVNFRANNGTWQQVSMSHVLDRGFGANITNLVGDLVVEYTITATDAFDETTTALNGTEYFRFSVSTGGGPPGFGDLLVPILILGVILAVGVVFLVYIFIIKKK